MPIDEILAECRKMGQVSSGSSIRGALSILAGKSEVTPGRQKGFWGLSASQRKAVKLSLGKS